MARALLGLVLAVVTTGCAVHAQSVSEQPNARLSLAVDWEKTIPGTLTQGIVQACIDRNKNLQLIITARPPFAANTGIWITFDSNGRVLEETPEPALETLSSVSVWCAQNGQIVLGISSQRVALRFSSSHQLLSREVLPQDFRSVFTDDTGTLLLAPFFGAAVLVSVQQDTSGVPISHAVATTSDSRFTPPSGRFVVPDPRNGTFVSLESSPENIAVYSRSGALLLKKSVYDSLCVRGAVVVGDPPAVCRDWEYGLFPLGRDLFIADVQHYSSFGETLEYQVLDRDFNVVGRVSATGVGTIVAADDDGNVYGVGGSSIDGRPQIQIIRAHLAQAH